MSAIRRKIKLSLERCNTHNKQGPQQSLHFLCIAILHPKTIYPMKILVYISSCRNKIYDLHYRIYTLKLRNDIFLHILCAKNSFLHTLWEKSINIWSLNGIFCWQLWKLLLSNFNFKTLLYLTLHVYGPGRRFSCLVLVQWVCMYPTINCYCF